MEKLFFSKHDSWFSICHQNKHITKILDSLNKDIITGAVFFWLTYYYSIARKLRLPIQANSVDPCIKIGLNIDSWNITQKFLTLAFTKPSVKRLFSRKIQSYFWRNLPGESIITTSSPSILHFSFGQTTRIFVLGSRCSLLSALPNWEIDCTLLLRPSPPFMLVLLSWCCS